MTYTPVAVLLGTDREQHRDLIDEVVKQYNYAEKDIVIIKYGLMIHAVHKKEPWAKEIIENAKNRDPHRGKV